MLQRRRISFINATEERISFINATEEEDIVY
jgi:hypothetical protein